MTLKYYLEEVLNRELCHEASIVACATAETCQLVRSTALLSLKISSQRYIDLDYPLYQTLCSAFTVRSAAMYSYLYSLYWDARVLDEPLMSEVLMADNDGIMRIIITSTYKA